MIASEWLYASLAILVGAHLVTLVYAAVVRSREVMAEAEARTPDADADAEDVEVCYCPECGAENDPGYRFCRNCIAELPGTPSARAPTGRRSHPN